MLMAIDTLNPLAQKYECDIAVQVRNLHEWMGTEGILFFFRFYKINYNIIFNVKPKKKLDVAGISWFFLVKDLINHLISKTLRTCIPFNNLEEPCKWHADILKG